MLIIRRSILEQPLFQTNDANLIEFYDKNNILNALLVKQFGPDAWLLVTSGDRDWDATLIRYGYRTVTGNPKDFLNKIKK